MQAQKNAPAGHIAAFLTILIWGTTFTSTKVLLRTFLPIEILFLRFALGLLALTLFYPKRLRLTDRRQNWLFAAAGLTGVTLYFLLENIALTMTTASNAGVIITLAPFFTAILSAIVLKTGRPKLSFFAGFVCAISGIAIISYSGSAALSINPMGDLLMVLAAASWSVYSILTRKISELGYNTILTTRRVFAYGVAFMLPLLYFMDFRPQLSDFASVANVGNLLYLGLGASALCFVSWGFAIRRLGPVKTSVYAYCTPVITLTASVLILGEPLTPMLLVGVALALVGLVVSELDWDKLKAGRMK